MDAVLLHVIYRETMSRLRLLQSRVDEGRDAMAASEFSRWLQFAGVIKLLENFPQGEPLPVDAAALRKAASGLAWDAGQLLKNGNCVDHSGSWEKICQRLANIETKLGVPVPDEVAPVAVLRES